MAFVFISCLRYHFCACDAIFVAREYCLRPADTRNGFRVCRSNVWFILFFRLNAGVLSISNCTSRKCKAFQNGEIFYFCFLSLTIIYFFVIPLRNRIFLPTHFPCNLLAQKYIHTTALNLSISEKLIQSFQLNKSKPIFPPQSSWRLCDGKARHPICRPVSDPSPLNTRLNICD